MTKFKSNLDVEEGTFEVRLVQVKGLHGTGLVKEIIDKEIDTETW